MAVSYKKLWKLLIDRDMKKCDLISKANISGNIVAKLGRNEYVSLETLDKICCCLDCDFDDIISIEKKE
jgi:Predicted transcriptional regulator